VEIRNSIGGTSQPGLGVGLANVKARLQHLYADDELASFEFHLEDTQAVARLVVPAAAPRLRAPLTEMEPA
jgi:LytS/YehU family sensor histidine kinase